MLKAINNLSPMTDQLNPLTLAAKVRSVTLDDAHDLQHTCWPDRTHDAIVEFLQRIAKLRAHRRGGGFVAERAGTICGFGLLTLWPRAAEISDLIVAPAYRSQGIGTQIISTLSNHARTLNATVVEIGVAMSNPRALALYRRMGFYDHHTLQIDLGSGLETVLYLEKQLQST